MTGEEFRDRRQLLGLSQAAIGRLMGLEYKAIARAEKRDRVSRLFELAMKQFEAEREREHRDVAA